MTDTNSKKDKTKAELEMKKQELQAELDHLQDELSDTFDKVRENLSEKMNVWYWIKKYPVSSLTLTFLVGFAAGKRNTKDQEGESISSTIFNEFKRIATQRAIRAVITQIEEKADKR